MYVKTNGDNEVLLEMFGKVLQINIFTFFWGGEKMENTD